MLASSGHIENYSSIRQALRRRSIAARAALTAEQHRHLSLQIDRHLTELLAAMQPGVIGFCWPIRAEYDAVPLVSSLLPQGWRACLPLVAAPDAPLLFRAWTPQSAMQADIHGIPHPVEGRPLHPQVLLIPVNACDHAGYRLGYGGGYFDRTLAAMQPRPLSIGLGFELCRVPSVHPQAHDIPLDRLVTEAGLYKFLR